MIALESISLCNLKKANTRFSTREINNNPGVEIEIINDLQSISIKSKDDHIIVPLTNISCIYLRSPKRLREESKDKQEKLTTNTVSIR